MSFRNSGVHVAQYEYDFDVDGGGQAAYDLAAKPGAPVIPQGAVLKGVVMKVVTAFAGASSVYSWGTSASADGYSGTAIAMATMVDDFVVSGDDLGASLLWDDTNDHKIYIAVNSEADASFEFLIATANATAGRAFFFCEYYYPSAS